MTWKTEIDRTVHEALRRAFDDRRGDGRRPITLANDFVALNPGRAASHFALGLVEESLHLRTLAREAGGRGRRHDGEAGDGAAADGGEGTAPTTPVDAAPATADARGAASAPASPSTNDRGDDDGGTDADEPADAAPQGPLPTLAESPVGEASLWRFLGRLDAASRGGPRARVRELAADPAMDLALPRADEGRMALRAVSRALLFGGEDARVYDLVLRHLRATNDEGSRRDADGLVGDAARHADDLSRDGDEAGASAALARALQFAVDAGLEGRAAAKVQRKVGRSHQLAGRWAEATAAYHDALARLSPDDRYRSVLQGDLALAALEVRGTLDLLPKEGRANVAEAERLLAAAQSGGEGESYNAIYTLGVLAYERGDWAKAAEHFREADRLMRETRAKARIVHARARFFLGACLLRLGATDEALREAEQCITRDVGAAALETVVKEPVFDLLVQALPSARIPGRAVARAEGGEPRDGREGGRRERGRRGGRGRDRDRGPRDAAPDAPGGSFDLEGGGGRPEAAERMDRYAGGRGDRPEQRPDAMPERMEPRPERMEPRPERMEPRPERMDPRPARPDRGERPDRARRGGPRHDGSREVHPAPAPATGAAPASAAGAFLATARRALDQDPHGALKAVDDTFKSRPTFEEWNASYRIRLEALIRLGEQGEARRTYERYRAKIHERARAERLEELLIDPSGPMGELLSDAEMKAELVDLYAAMPGRETVFVEAATALGKHHADLGTPADLRVAVSLLREAVALGGEEARGLWTDVATRARAAGVAVDGPAAEDIRARFAARGGPAKVVVVGGDDAGRGHVLRVEDLGRRAGFEGSLVLGGARPPQKTLADVEAAARGATAIVVLHSATPEVRDGVKRLGGDLAVPVRELPYAGPASLEPELLSELSSL